MGKLDRITPTQITNPDPERQLCEADFYLMANLGTKTTGLPFIIWFSQKGDLGDDVCICVSKDLKALPCGLTVVLIRPQVRVIKGRLRTY